MNLETKNRWEHPIVIFGKDNCTFCKKAEELCREKGAGVVYQNVGESLGKGTRSYYLADVFKNAGFTTVPIIFHAGQLIGGYNELELYLELGYVP